MSMADKIKEVEDEIKEASKEVDRLFALRKLNEASFDSDTLKVEQLRYYMGMVKSLRDEKILLMSPSTPAPPGNSLTLPQVLPLLRSSFPPGFPPPFCFVNQLQINYRCCGGVDEGGRETGFVDGLLCSGFISLSIPNYCELTLYSITQWNVA
jgi:hypothetical protein